MPLAATGRVAAVALPADGTALPVAVTAMQPICRRLLPVHELQ
jgi:hypothetical protein